MKKRREMYEPNIYISISIGRRLILNEENIKIYKTGVVTSETMELGDGIISSKSYRSRGFLYRVNTERNKIEIIDPDDNELCGQFLFYIPESDRFMHEQFHGSGAALGPQDLHCVIFMNIMVDQSGALSLIDLIKYILRCVLRKYEGRINSGKDFLIALQNTLCRKNQALGTDYVRQEQERQRQAEIARQQERQRQEAERRKQEQERQRQLNIQRQQQEYQRQQAVQRQQQQSYVTQQQVPEGGTSSSKNWLIAGGVLVVGIMLFSHMNSKTNKMFPEPAPKTVTKTHTSPNNTYSKDNAEKEHKIKERRESAKEEYERTVRREEELARIREKINAELKNKQNTVVRNASPSPKTSNTILPGDKKALLLLNQRHGREYSNEHLTVTKYFDLFKTHKKLKDNYKSLQIIRSHNEPIEAIRENTTSDLNRLRKLNIPDGTKYSVLRSKLDKAMVCQLNVINWYLGPVWGAYYKLDEVSLLHTYYNRALRDVHEYYNDNSGSF